MHHYMAGLLFILVIICLLHEADSSVNVALGKPVNSSSVGNPQRLPGRVVDGTTRQTIDFCFHSAVENATWWSVDLGMVYNLEFIRIYYRDENTVRRFIGYQIYYSNSSDFLNGELCYSNEGDSYPGVRVEHTCTYKARYVTVYKTRQNNEFDHDGAILELCEVQIFGCRNGYYGYQNCDNSCDGCVEADCTPTYGDCIEPGCADGYFGINCRQQCPSNCKDSKCAADTGHCTDCKDGYFGQTCSFSCSANCLNGKCDFTTGRCDGNACTDGYFGPYCSTPCPQNCDPLKCDFNTGECSACKDGFYGPTCGTSCPENCLGRRCNISNGLCIACEDGYYGPKCETACSINCLGRRCNATNGHCIACVNGLYGEQCQMTCNANCYMGMCDILSGDCAKCRDGYYGTTCGMTCSKNCLLVRCDITSGQCAGDSCVDGFYGMTCDKNCPQNCNASKCEFTSGFCTECRTGYHGNTCSQQCPSQCENDRCNFQDGACLGDCMSQRFGQRCTETCSTCNGNCDRTGNCLLGCVDGWEGRRCDKGSSNNTSLIIGIIVGILVIVGLAVFAFLFVTRRRNMIGKHSGNDAEKYDHKPYTNNHLNGIPSTNNTGGNSEGILINAGKENVVYVNNIEEQTYQNTEPSGITLEQFKQTIQEKLHDDAKILKEEFETFPNKPLHPCKVASSKENQKKNRYKTTYPYDHSRVTLDASDGVKAGGYINASYIDGTEQLKEYVATQGPKDNTYNDFWQMVWQLNSGKIIMLTNLIENGKVKCGMYWPEDGNPPVSKTFDLAMESHKKCSFYEIRKIKMTSKATASCRTVSQYHFTTWPDHGIPDSQELVQFHRRVMRDKSDLSGPDIVHCSAGIGRTGTYIALDTLYKRGKRTGRIDVQGYVHTMRKNRMNMIQTVDQYICLYKTLDEAFDMPETAFSKHDFIKQFSEIEKNIPKLKEEFEILLKRKPTKDSIDYSASLQQENIKKNATEDVLADERYRILINDELYGSDYINAIRVPMFQAGIRYIVTQHPVPDTVEHFWSMVDDYSVKTIVVFVDNEKPQENQWLPSDEASLKLQFGEIKWQNTAMKPDDTGVTQNDLVLSIKDPKEDIPVTVLMARCCSSSSTLKCTKQQMLTLTDLLKKRKLDEDHQIVVMCPDGASCCGLFCVHLNNTQQLTYDGDVDILQSARRILNRRPEFIQSFDQYMLCYEAMVRYIETSDVYENV